MSIAEDTAASKPAKSRLVFLPCSVQEFEDEGFFSYPACFQLTSFVRRRPGLAERWDAEVLWSLPPASLPITIADRSWEQLLYEVIERRPRIIAFSLYAWRLQHIHNVARHLRQMLPDVLLMAGGPEVVDRERFVERWEAFDILVEGDGELVLADVLDAVAASDPPDLSGIVNVSWRGPEGWTHNPRQDVRAGWETIPNYYEDYADILSSEAFFLSSRGCKRHCKYCQWPSHGFNEKSSEQILAELETLVSNPRVQTLHFCDFDFLETYRTDLDTFRRVAELIKRRPDMKVKFATSPTQLGMPRLREVFELLPVREAQIGIQSMVPAVLERMNRGWSMHLIDRLDEVDFELRTRIAIQLIFPLPGETPESLYDGVERVLSLGYCRLRIFPLMVLGGTTLRGEAESLGLKYFDDPPHYCYESPTFPREEWRVAVGFAWVLSGLVLETDQELEWLAVLQRYVTTHPELVRRILADVRRRRPLSETLGELVLEVFGADGPASRRAAEAEAASAPAAPAPDEPVPPPGGDNEAPGRSSAPASVPRSRYPSQARIQTALAHLGCAIAEELRGDELVLRVSGVGAETEIRLFPDGDERLFYRRFGGLKVAYGGRDTDLALVDEVVAALEGLA